MMTKTMMLIAIKVGIIRIRRWTVYPSMPAALLRPRASIARCGFSAVREPEAIRPVHAEMRARVPAVNRFFRHVAQPLRNHHRLRHSRHRPDREDLIGADLQHGVPQPFLLFA